jgi:hypothetical protein
MPEMLTVEEVEKIRVMGSRVPFRKRAHSRVPLAQPCDKRLLQ